MLGLGTSVTNIDSGQIYKELSELSNYADLDIHFDFSTLTGDHGDAVTDVVNTGATSISNRINSSEGTPALDKKTLSRTCVDFPNTSDSDNILDMAASYTTTAKAMTFFIVFQWDVAGTQILVANADDGDDDYIKLLGGGRMGVKMSGGDAVAVQTSNTDGGTVNYTPALNKPIVYLIKRDENGACLFFADNNIHIATVNLEEPENFTLGAIGGTTSGSLADFNGKICEVGIYDADIGATNVAILLESLCTKWGIDRRE